MDILKIALGIGILAVIWPAVTYYPGILGTILSILLLLVGLKILLNGFGIRI